jgi:hypothetical protein
MLREYRSTRPCGRKSVKPKKLAAITHTCFALSANNQAQKNTFLMPGLIKFQVSCEISHVPLDAEYVYVS